MLKVGGRVAYSTCSMNPVENEAVISSAVDRCGGAEKVELIDCSKELPELKRSSGLNDWKVMDKEGRMWNSWSDVEDAKAEKFQASLERVAAGMFPSQSEKLPLERCTRVYPHQQDTGGFFIAVLEKKSEIKARPESQAKTPSSIPSVVSIAKELVSKPAEEGVIPKLETAKELLPDDIDLESRMDQGNASATQRQNKANIPDTVAEPATNKRSIDDVHGDAPTAVAKRARTEKDDGVMGGIAEPGQMEHFPLPPSVQLATAGEDSSVNGNAGPPSSNRRKQNQPHEESFKYLAPDHPEIESIFKFYQLSPRFPRDRFMVRNAGGEPVKAIYYTTELAKEILTKNEGRGMKFVHSGVKMFVKQDAQGQDVCRWRIQSEGLPIIEGWVGEDRVVRLHRRDTLQLLLREMFPKLSNDGWKSLGEIGERVRDIKMGCCVLRVEASEEEGGFK